MNNSVDCKGDKSSVSSDTLWQFQTHREEIAPAHWVDVEMLYEGKATLALSGDGKAYANGCWSLELDVTPGNFYEFQTCFRQTKVDEPNRTILARIVWKGKDGKQVTQPEYPETLREQTPKGWNIIRQRYRVPEDAVTAKLELVYRWDDNGIVHFSEATFKEVQEIEGGVTPGNSIPVFDTEFGRIGMMICWDLQFPEVARQLAMQGAEVIFMPIWGGNLTLARARAIENQVYLVSSSYDMTTGVFNLEGELIAEANDQDPVAVVEVDLNKQLLWPWLGDLKNRIPREKPDTEITAHSLSHQ